MRSILSLVLSRRLPPLNFQVRGKKGETRYQNFPCESESIALAPQDVSAPKKSPVAPAEPGVMTTDEVKAIWGEPTETVQEEPGKGPRVEVWSYGDSRSVRLIVKGASPPYSSRV